ncbi:RHS repeat-associated core domain-containing protein, partial [Marinomonas transparens]
EYTPFGKMVENQSTGTDNYRAKFAGKERDSGTGLSYFGHRYYDADIGRFISPDPAAQYHSPYLYGADDPLTMVDPNGEFAFLTFAILMLSGLVSGYMAGWAVSDSMNPGNWSGKAWAAAGIGFLIGFIAGRLGFNLTGGKNFILGMVEGALRGVNKAFWRGESEGGFLGSALFSAAIAGTFRGYTKGWGQLLTESSLKIGLLTVTLFGATGVSIAMQEQPQKQPYFKSINEDKPVDNGKGNETVGDTGKGNETVGSTGKGNETVGGTGKANETVGGT